MNASCELFFVMLELNIGKVLKECRFTLKEIDYHGVFECPRNCWEVKDDKPCDILIKYKKGHHGLPKFAFPCMKITLSIQNVKKRERDINEYDVYLVDNEGYIYKGEYLFDSETCSMPSEKRKDYKAGAQKDVLVAFPIFPENITPRSIRIVDYDDFISFGLSDDFSSDFQDIGSSAYISNMNSFLTNEILLRLDDEIKSLISGLSNYALESEYNKHIIFEGSLNRKVKDIKEVIKNLQFEGKPEMLESLKSIEESFEEIKGKHIKNYRKRRD